MNTLKPLILAYCSAICCYFIFRLFANKKSPQGQKYIAFLFVINIVVGIINLLSIVVGNYDAIISLLINAMIIVGCRVQSNTLSHDV